MKPDKTPKNRVRMWVKGDSGFNQQFVEWAKSNGMIAEDLHRKILDEAMRHNAAVFCNDRGYSNRQTEPEKQNCPT